MFGGVMFAGSEFAGIEFLPVAVPIVVDFAAGPPQRASRPFRAPKFVHVDGRVHLVLSRLQFSAFGDVRPGVFGVVGLEFEAFTIDVQGQIVRPVAGEVLVAMRALEAASFGATSSRGDLNEQRLLSAFRALPSVRQAEILRWVKDGRKVISEDEEDEYLLTRH